MATNTTNSAETVTAREAAERVPGVTVRLITRWFNARMLQPAGVVFGRNFGGGINRYRLSDIERLASAPKEQRIESERAAEKRRSKRHRNKLTCCLACGRDTRHHTGICKRCMKGLQE